MKLGKTKPEANSQSYPMWDQTGLNGPNEIKIERGVKDQKQAFLTRDFDSISEWLLLDGSYLNAVPHAIYSMKRVTYLQSVRNPDAKHCR